MFRRLPSLCLWTISTISHQKRPFSSVTILKSKEKNNIDENFKNITDEEWSRRLTPQQYKVCRKGGTEAPGTGEYYLHYENGTYSCVCCGSKLFSSETKYSSGSGWPSFYAGTPGAIKEQQDLSLGMNRTEVLCAKCNAHLGHVFEDGPPPTQLRYCINSVCLQFQPSNQTEN